MEKRINKYVYTWVGTFLFGVLSVNKFMRGKVKLGILNLLIVGIYMPFGISFLVEGNLAGLIMIALAILWPLIDWLIALNKLGKYEKVFVFEYNGKWDKSYTKEAIEKKAKEDAESELREKERQEQEKERKEKYKKDIESGVISYEEELKKVQAIEEEFLKYRTYFKAKMAESSSLVKEFTEKTRPGCDWDTGWYNMTVDKIKNLKIDHPAFDTAFLTDLFEIKGDSRISNLKSEIQNIIFEYQQINNQLTSYQYRLNHPYG